MPTTKDKAPKSTTSASTKRRRKRKVEPTSGPAIPKGQGIRKCQFCRLYFRDALKHEASCSRNPDRKRHKGEKAGHGQKRRFPVQGKPGSAKKRRIKAASEREAANLPTEVIYKAYHPGPRSPAVVAASAKPKPGPIRIDGDSAPKEHSGGIVRCKFCNHPAMSGDEICRDHSSD